MLIGHDTCNKNQFYSLWLDMTRLNLTIDRTNGKHANGVITVSQAKVVSSITRYCVEFKFC